MHPIQRQFTNAGLPAPPIPRRFANDMRELHEWQFGDQQLPPGVLLSDQDAILSAAQEGTLNSALYFGHGGYGTNNWAMFYHLILPELLILLQIPYGGAYRDESTCREELAHAFQEMDELLRLLELATQTGRWPDKRLVVVHRPYDESYWRWRPRTDSTKPADTFTSGELHLSLDASPVADALPVVASLVNTPQHTNMTSLGTSFSIGGGYAS